MWSRIEKINYSMYLITAAWFPSSSHSELSRKWRCFWARRIVRSLGVGVNIERFAKFTPELSIRDHSGIGINACINGPVTIGKDVMMGQDVIIYTTRHNDDRVDVPMRNQGMKEVSPVSIEDDVWIGGRVIVLHGVTIGRGSIIGAGSVVSKSIPEYSVAVGAPARVVRNRMLTSTMDEDK